MLGTGLGSAVVIKVLVESETWLDPAVDREESEVVAGVSGREVAEVTVTAVGGRKVTGKPDPLDDDAEEDNDEINSGSAG